MYVEIREGTSGTRSEGDKYNIHISRTFSQNNISITSLVFMSLYSIIHVLHLTLQCIQTFKTCIYFHFRVTVASPQNLINLAKYLYQDCNVTCHVYLRVGGIMFASFYNLSIGLWICSESVAFVFQFYLIAFCLAIVIGYYRNQHHNIVCVGNRFKTSYNLIHKFR